MPKEQQARSCPYECSKSEVIDSIDGKVDNLEINMDKIVVALTGDKLNPNGLIEARAQDHIRIRRIENKISYMVYAGTGALAVLTFIFKILPLIADKA